MEYKFLVRKNVILDGGLPYKADSTVIVPFNTMDIALATAENVGDHITLITQAKFDEELSNGVFNAHKSIMGEIEVSDVAQMNQVITNFNAGQDIALKDGTSTNNRISDIGEVYYFVPTTGSSFATEEALVETGKNLIVISHANSDIAKLTDLDTEVKKNSADILTKTDEATIDAKVLLETTGRIDADTLLRTRITANENSLNTINTELTGMQQTDADLSGRVEAIEQGESLQDKVWTGSISLIPDLNISSITDENGDVFDFDLSDRIEIIVEHTTDLVEDGEVITVGSTNEKSMTIGTKTIGIKLGNDGHLTITGADLADLSLVEVREKAAAKASVIAYTKAESDAKYETKAHSTTELATKQNAIDNAILDGIDNTNTKSVVGAINALHLRTTNTEDDTKLLNAGTFDVKGDGTVIVQMLNADGSLTDAFKALIGVRTNAEINALIDAKLNTVMSITFDNASTEVYNINK